ncbi:SMEK domain-containing protein [Neolewinella antarctica]|uniref:SMEK domain-containing protein n=1 Tax=Neolewinella antarctica TaxID=442734 RepID=A0ABX0XGJ5_9BACT|nr:SMEK domain-containing protein [Neolewinella antarctica]NJC28265.1 hypothetical protein [Neolewinella antarctica]
MITRGIIIGRIIDDLSSLSEKIEFRASVQMYDINRILENFARDIIKISYKYSDIVNLNGQRSNEPGIDLGTTLHKIGIQVTSKADSEKVNNTFRKLTSEQQKNYNSIQIFVLGSRQGSYTAIDNSLIPTTIQFDKNKDIFDFKDFCKKVIDLEIKQLIELNELFDDEFLVVNSSLSQVNNQELLNGPKLFDIQVFKPAVNGLKVFKGFPIEVNESEEFLDIINNEGNKLVNIPIRTRRILCHIIDLGKRTVESISKDGRKNFVNERSYLIPKLIRTINLSEREIEQEINILVSEEFIIINQEELDVDIDLFEAAVVTYFREHTYWAINYATENNLLTKLIIDLDFTILDE